MARNSAINLNITPGGSSSYTYLDYSGTMIVHKRTAVSDAAYTVLSTDFLIAYTALTAARTVTLPDASLMANRWFYIKDESGSAGTYNITVATTAGNIDGASTKVINSNYGWIGVYCNGSSYVSHTGSLGSITTGGVSLTAATTTSVPLTVTGATGSTAPFAVFTGGTLAASSGIDYAVKITPTYNQTSTAGATDLLINRTQTAVGSGSQYLIDVQVAGTTKFNVSNTGLISTATGIITPKIYPAADSTTAVGIYKADGTTKIVNIDTTNGAVYFGGQSSVVGGSIYLANFVQGAAPCYMSFNNTNSGFNNTDGFQFGLETNGDVYLLNREAGNMFFRTSDVTRFTLATDGTATFARTGVLSSGTDYGVKIIPTYNQTSTAGATDLLINRTQTAVGSGTHNFIDCQVSASSKFSVSSVMSGGSATSNFLNLTNTMPTTLTAGTYAARIVITSAGSSSQENGAFSAEYQAGYTGSQTTFAIRGYGQAAGTGQLLWNAAGSQVSNIGVLGVQISSTTGYNVGVNGVAWSSSTLNVGVVGAAVRNLTAPAINVGVIGAAHPNSGGSGTICGGHFCLNSGNPTLVTAALVCDNAAYAADIFVARDNATTVFNIADGGVVTAVSTYVASSGTDYAVKITPTYNQTSTAGSTDLLINRTNTAIGSGSHLLLDGQVAGTSRFKVSHDGSITAKSSVSDNNLILDNAGGRYTGIYLDNSGTIKSMLFYDNTNAQTVFGSYGNASLELYTSNTSRVSISSTGITTFSYDVKIGTVGKGIYIKEGSDATMGTGTLSAGTATISTTKVTASSRIFLCDSGGGVLANIGSLSVGTVVAATSFVVNSTNVLDSSNFNWLIIEPA